MDFYQITGPENSKENNFSSFCSSLILSLYPNAKPVNGRGGDEGIDTFIGEFDGKLEVYQHKYFIDKVGSPQKKQIEQSLNSLIKNHKEVVKWTLMLPKDLNPTEIRWFEKLKEKYLPLPMDWFGKTKLQELCSKFPQLEYIYQPKPYITNIVINSGFNLIDSNDTKLIEALKDKIPFGSSNVEFESTLKNILELFRNQVKLKVLIWGPTENGGEIYKKRCQIRDRIISLGHSADFSEDVLTPELLRRTGLNLKVSEFIQAICYDYVICLMSSPGSIGEVHDFANNKTIASKMMICIDQVHKTGYSANGALQIFEGYNGKVDWFENPKDLLQCYLSGRVIEHISKVAQAKQYEISTKSLGS